MAKTKSAPKKTIDELISGETAAKVNAALEQNLLDYLKLGLCVKQAHWNLVGPHFMSLHVFLDKVYASAQTFSDETAERIRQLRGFPNGNADAITKQSTFDGMPQGAIQDMDAASEILARLEATISAARARLEEFEEDEVVTADLVHAQVMAFEEHAWMLRSILGRS